MKKSISLIVFILAPFLLFTEGISLVVTRVEPIGVEAETARLVEELLHTELSQIPRIYIVIIAVNRKEMSNMFQGHA